MYYCPTVGNQNMPKITVAILYRKYAMFFKDFVILTHKNEFSMF